MLHVYFTENQQSLLVTFNEANEMTFRPIVDRPVPAYAWMSSSVFCSSLSQEDRKDISDAIRSHFHVHQSAIELSWMPSMRPVIGVMLRCHIRVTRKWKQIAGIIVCFRETSRDLPKSCRYTHSLMIRESICTEITFPLTGQLLYWSSASRNVTWTASNCVKLNVSKAEVIRSRDN